MDSGENLCLACGLCCDGSLFDNVRFGPDEAANELKALGLPVKASRARVPVPFVSQPCAALCADRACRIYANRPGQCRTFECGVFREMQADRISFDSAMGLVQQAQRKAGKARRLLRKLGDHEETLSLGKRFRRAQRRVESGSVDSSAADTFSKLGLAMHQFDLLAHKKFYTQADAP